MQPLQIAHKHIADVDQDIAEPPPDMAHTICAQIEAIKCDAINLLCI